MNRNCNKIHIFIVILLLVNNINAANILFYFAVSSYSHRISAWPLVEALAERGHNVTFLSPFPPKVPNPKVTEFTPESLMSFVNKLAGGMLDRRLKGIHKEMWYDLPQLGQNVCEVLLKSDETKDWIKKSKFDLVVIDLLFNECGLGLAYAFQSKFLYFATGIPHWWFPDVMGHVLETSWIPDIQFHFPEKLSFLQKVVSTLQPLYWQYYVKEWNYFTKMEQLLRKELEIPDMPDLRDLERNTSLFFINTHYSVEYPRSLPPAYVSVGGLQIQDSKKSLPKDLSNFIAESGEGGVVYISFGSVAEVSTFPPDLLQVFYKVLGSFRSTRFIWKWNVERPADMPENVMTVKWVLQAELLSHKSVKAFITHGGGLSTQEATYYGVPLIVIPIFADQDYNAQIIERSGCGIKLEIVGITEDVLKNGISKLLGDNSYKKKMSELSHIFRDRPAKPLETAIWWTEYVLRHEDTAYLKPFGINQTWYERRLLDVWIFLFSIILVICAVFSYVLCRYFTKSKHNIPTKKIKTQ